MLLTKFPALFLILIARTCVAEIRIKTSEPNHSALYVEATVDILTSCYASRHRTVGVVGDLPENLIEALWSRQRIPIILISVPMGPVKYGRNFPKFYSYKLQRFLIVASSFDEMVHNVNILTRSKYWNHAGSILILYWSSKSNKECRNYPNQLYVASQLGVLNANVMCHDSTRGMIVFGYNPYTNQAPKPWKLHATLRGLRNHPWSTFIRKYEKGASICENLNFDKTTDLGGYNVVLVSTRLEDDHINNGNIEINYHLNLVVRALNGTAIMIRRVYQRSIDQFSTLRDGTADVSMDLSEQYLNNPMLYPIRRHRLYIMTQYRGHKTQLQKILSVIDVNSQIGVYVVLSLTVIFFKCVVGQAFIPAILNVVRIICNTGFLNIPRNVAPRFFLTGLLLFAVTMQGIYQGLLASLLTSHIPLPDINSMQDLANSDHTIYGIKSLAPYFYNPKFAGRFIGLERMDCVEYVKRDSLAACINLEPILIEQAQTFKLHLSAKHIATVELSWFVQHNWPLIQKFNKALISMFESDINGDFKLRWDNVTATDFVFDEDIKNNVERRVMTLTDLRFAFVMLGIGLACASITFVVELAIVRYRSRVRTVAVQFLT